MNIPLLIESKAYVENLKYGCSKYDENNYTFHKRVNFSYRFASSFLEEQKNLFIKNPDLYLRNYGSKIDCHVEDVYKLKIDPKDVFRILLKILSHKLFKFLGDLNRFSIRRKELSVYRKCYVDDIDLVYDPLSKKTLLAVYPFPIKISRQIKFIFTIFREKRSFRLDGYNYPLKYVFGFLRKRTVRSYADLETISSYLKVQEILRSDIEEVELSDEFDINTLSFSKFCRRKGIYVVNKAHGIGKYFPIQSFDEFYYLDSIMRDYYLFHKEIKLFNFNLISKAPVKKLDNAGDNCLLFVSQIFSKRDEEIISDEIKVMDILKKIALEKNLNFYYKKHPNLKEVIHSNSEEILFIDNINELYVENEIPIIFSFFSSTHIDPSFVGFKYLIETKYLKPSIAFTDENILFLSKLEEELPKIIDLTRNCTDHRISKTGNITL